MDIGKIFDTGRKVDDIIEDLKQNTLNIPTWANLEKDFDTKNHDVITDSTRRPKDKMKGRQRDVAAKITYEIGRASCRESV